MVTLVDDDVPVPLGEVGDVVAAGQGGQHRDAHDSAEFAPTTADLPGPDAQELFDPGAPLFGQGLRSTSTRVDAPRSAISAQAMTVFPDPGGATSTPSSCASSALTATPCLGSSSAPKATAI